MLCFCACKKEKPIQQPVPIPVPVPSAFSWMGTTYVCQHVGVSTVTNLYNYTTTKHYYYFTDTVYIKNVDNDSVGISWSYWQLYRDAPVNDTVFSYCNYYTHAECLSFSKNKPDSLFYSLSEEITPAEMYSDNAIGYKIH